MNTKSRNVKYGVVILVPLVISMLFIGMNAISNASQSNGLELDASAPQVQIWLEATADGNPIQGDSQAAGRENMIEVYTFRHDIVVPTDATGMATGKRVHNPIVITKTNDKSSPLIYQALSQNQIVDATFHFYRTNPSDGSLEEYYSIEFQTGAVISSRAFTFTDDQGASYQMEEVSFVYHTITWTNTIEGISYTDTWDSE